MPATSRKPSPYPWYFHGLRLGQLLSSIVVGTVLCYFIDHLRDEDYPIPWTFILLLTTSLLTLAHLLVTTYIHFTRTLNPATHVISTAVLTACWLVSLALLTWNLSWTLGHRCIRDRWHNTTGIAICRMYKALTAFAVCGALTTIISLILDVQVGRSSKARGTYNQMGNVKPPIIRLVSGEGEETRDPRSNGEGWERRSHEGTVAYKVQKPIGAKQFQYEQPSEQSSYGGGGNYF